eukprot:15481075-Alexandrium_andersonii.AAC.1
MPFFWARAVPGSNAKEATLHFPHGGLRIETDCSTVPRPTAPGLRRALHLHGFQPMIREQSAWLFSLAPF